MKVWTATLRQKMLLPVALSFLMFGLLGQVMLLKTTSMCMMLQWQSKRKLFARLDVGDYIASRPGGPLKKETRFEFIISPSNTTLSSAGNGEQYTLRAQNEQQLRRCLGLFTMVDTESSSSSGDDGKEAPAPSKGRSVGGPCRR